MDKKLKYFLLIFLIMGFGVFSFIEIYHYSINIKKESILKDKLKNTKFITKFGKVKCKNNFCSIENVDILLNKNNLLKIKKININNINNLNKILNMNLSKKESLSTIKFLGITRNNQKISKPFIDSLKYKISNDFNVKKMEEVMKFIEPRYNNLNICLKIKAKELNNSYNFLTKLKFSFDKEFIKLESKFLIKKEVLKIKKPVIVKSKMDLIAYNEKIMEQIYPKYLKISINSKDKDFILNLYKLAFKIEKGYFNENDFKIEVDSYKKALYEYIDLDLKQYYDNDMKNYLEDSVDRIFYGESSQIEVNLKNKDNQDLTELIKAFYQLFKKDSFLFKEYIKITH